MTHITKIEETTIGQGQPMPNPMIDSDALPVFRPLVLWVWTCSCGDGCGFYLERSGAEQGAVRHRLAHSS